MNERKQQLLAEIGKKVYYLRLDEELTVPQEDGFTITFDDMVDHLTAHDKFDVFDHSEHGDARVWTWLDNENESANVRYPVCLIVWVDDSGDVRIQRDEWLTVTNMVPIGMECPECRTANLDLLITDEDGKVTCTVCGGEYAA